MRARRNEDAGGRGPLADQKDAPIDGTRKRCLIMKDADPPREFSFLKIGGAI
jgi:hypothetical protein